MTLQEAEKFLNDTLKSHNDTLVHFLSYTLELKNDIVELHERYNNLELKLYRLQDEIAAMKDNTAGGCDDAD